MSHENREPPLAAYVIDATNGFRACSSLRTRRNLMIRYAKVPTLSAIAFLAAMGVAMAAGGHAGGSHGGGGGGGVGGSAGGNSIAGGESTTSQGQMSSSNHDQGEQSDHCFGSGWITTEGGGEGYACR
jgi:hypothetical protein